MELVDYIEKNKIIVIVRQLYGEPLLRLAEALKAGGLTMMEVTFDQVDPDCLKKTPEAIAMIKEHFKDGMKCGAGTVLTEAQVQAAAEAGAEYIISPNVDERVIRLTKAKGLISIPGAMTPTEILKAHEYGADLVKVFPVSDLGLSYIKSIRGPINHVKIMATGGVTEENFSEMLEAGFSGAGISGRLTDKKLVAAGDWEEFTRRASAFARLASDSGSEA